MRKYIFLLVAVLCVAGFSNSAAGVLDFNPRQRASLYVKAGQVWNTIEAKNVSKTRPTVYGGGGLNIRLSEDMKWNVTAEVKKGLQRNFTSADWSISYKF